MGTSQSFRSPEQNPTPAPELSKPELSKPELSKTELSKTELSKNDRQWSEFAMFAFSPDARPHDCDSAEAWDSQSAIDEARDLYRAVNQGALTIEETRELIAVPPRIASVLLAYARAQSGAAQVDGKSSLGNDEDAEFIQGILRFRRHIAEEFEFLVATGGLTEN